MWRKRRLRKARRRDAALVIGPECWRPKWPRAPPPCEVEKERGQGAISLCQARAEGRLRDAETPLARAAGLGSSSGLAATPAAPPGERRTHLQTVMRFRLSTAALRDWTLLRLREAAAAALGPPRPSDAICPRSTARQVPAGLRRRLCSSPSAAEQEEEKEEAEGAPLSDNSPSAALLGPRPGWAALASARGGGSASVARASLFLSPRPARDF